MGPFQLNFKLKSTLVSKYKPGHARSESEDVGGLVKVLDPLLEDLQDLELFVEVDSAFSPGLEFATDLQIHADRHFGGKTGSLSTGRGWVSLRMRTSLVSGSDQMQKLK